MTKQDQLIQYLISSQEALIKRIDRLDQLLTTGAAAPVLQNKKSRKKANSLDAMAEREVAKFIHNLNRRFR